MEEKFVQVPEQDFAALMVFVKFALDNRYILGDGIKKRLDDEKARLANLNALGAVFGAYYASDDDYNRIGTVAEFVCEKFEKRTGEKLGQTEVLDMISSALYRESNNFEDRTRLENDYDEFWAVAGTASDAYWSIKDRGIA